MVQKKTGRETKTTIKCVKLRKKQNTQAGPGTLTTKTPSKIL